MNESFPISFHDHFSGIASILGAVHVGTSGFDFDLLLFAVICVFYVRAKRQNRIQYNRNL